MMRALLPFFLLALQACDKGETGGTDTGPSTVDSDSATPSGTDEDGDGWTVEDGDCDDSDPDINPGADDPGFDGIDQDCSGTDSADGDVDGYDAVWYGGDDCDDEDPAIHPGATEICGDGVDQDCSGDPDDGSTDADGDGFVDWACTGGSDCDDGDSAVQPGMSVHVPDDYDNVVDAVAAVCSDSTVTVASGTYQGNIEAAGKALTLVSESGAASTVLEGDGTATVVALGTAGGETVFSGFTVTGGVDEYGGGLYCTGICAITDSIFTGNEGHFGGGIALVEAEVELSSCQFASNLAQLGAGIYADEVLGSVSDVSFHGDLSWRYGGAIYAWFSEFDISRATVDGTISEAGGGFYLYNHNGRVEDSSFDSCSAESAGGVMIRESVIDLVDNSFTNNWGRWGGAGFYCWDSVMDKLDTNYFAGNTYYDCDDYTTVPCIDVACRGCYGCP